MAHGDDKSLLEEQVDEARLKAVEEAVIKFGGDAYWKGKNK